MAQAVPRIGLGMLRLCSGHSGYPQACLPAAQVKAAATHVQRLKRTRRKKKLILSLGVSLHHAFEILHLPLCISWPTKRAMRISRSIIRPVLRSLRGHQRRGREKTEAERTAEAARRTADEQATRTAVRRAEATRAGNIRATRKAVAREEGRLVIR
jgi:hypothetical protein